MRPSFPWRLALGALLGCSSAPTDETPSGAVLLFSEAVARSDVDARSLEVAYGLLASPAQEQLRARAEFTRALSGRLFKPWEMLVQGRFHFHVEATEDNLTERIDGTRATVTITGPQSSATIPLVREAGHWRLALELPGQGSQ